MLAEPDPEHVWLVDDLLLAGGFSIIAGKPKSGKSTFSRALALAVARGTPFLGRETMKGRVLLLSLEDHRPMLRRYLQVLGATASDDILVFCQPGRRLGIDDLRRAVSEHKPALAIVDTLFRLVRPSDLNAYLDVVQALDPLLRLCRDHNCHVAALHHFVKAAKSDSADAVLGSTAIVGSVDSSVLIKRHGQARSVEVQQRYTVDLPPTPLIFDHESGAVDLGATLGEAVQERVEDAIVTALRDCDLPPTEAELVRLVRGSTRAKRSALRALVKTGAVERLGEGGRRSPFRYSCSSSYLYGTSKQPNQHQPQL
jgi:hypothetical protein